MLTAITIATTVGGAVLGLRYNVLILAPAFLFVLLAVIGAGVARGAGIRGIALEMLVATTALQLGYLGGGAFAVARMVRKPNRESPSFGPVRAPMPEPTQRAYHLNERRRLMSAATNRLMLLPGTRRHRAASRARS